jgi:hypothetical protein
MKAWQLLEEKDWCQYALAKDSQGFPVRSNSSQACCFCVIGLLAAVADTSLKDSFSSSYSCLEAHIEKTFNLTVVRWNDHPERTKEEVLAVLKELDI